MAYNSEQQPLLDESGYPRDSLNAPETSEEVIISPRKRVFIYVLCILVIFIQEIGGIVESIPLSQLTERIICQKFSDQTLAANLSGVVAPGPGRCKETEYVYPSITAQTNPFSTLYLGTLTNLLWYLVSACRGNLPPFLHGAVQ